MAYALQYSNSPMMTSAYPMATMPPPMMSTSTYPTMILPPMHSSNTRDMSGSMMAPMPMAMPMSTMPMPMMGSSAMPMMGMPMPANGGWTNNPNNNINSNSMMMNNGMYNPNNNTSNMMMAMGGSSHLNNMSMMNMMAGGPTTFPSLATRTSGATIESRFDQRVKVLHICPLRSGMRAEAERLIGESMRIWQSMIGLLYCSFNIVNDTAYLMVEWANQDCLVVGTAEWDRGNGKEVFNRLFRDCIADMNRCQTYVIGNNINLRDSRIPGPLRTLFDHAIIVPCACGFFR